METATSDLVTGLKALADPVRVRLAALCSAGEASVSELTEVLGLSQPRVSQHLKTLVDAGLIERFRDGHFVYYRVPQRSSGLARRLLSLLPRDEPEFGRDLARLQRLRGDTAGARPRGPDDADRALHRALIALTVATPLGDLLDIGCGQGRILKLLASRAQRAVGVDIDADARRFARAQLLLAGIPNCTLRQGDMYALPFADGEFDTVILDDVLGSADRPLDALAEAARLLQHGGRLLLLQSLSASEGDALRTACADWCRAAGLRLSPPRTIPVRAPRWLLAVATPADTSSAAA
ncbi:MAG: metalloregulator ArsR/SmtB family transcription factor [Woeseiaceae bacterium]|nr:metalloregulator ArsR/SmtB family transcription factor [Woeseiaceae bacterium]